MTDNTIIFAVVFVYLAFLIFGTHFIRTWAFNRHEAITFESSSIATLLMLLLIWQYGLSVILVLLFVLFLLMFIGNALTQWHFYMVLQDIIEKAFAKRAGYLKKHGYDPSVNEALLTMASVAIMPSFSRFIEESKLFNNPGGFIGLVKSIMKRQRFQKKKYLMRECFAENINLIGPCKPEIDKMMKDDRHVIPGAIHANDLALGYSDEKKGLFTYDIFGFGAHIGIFIILFYNVSNPLGSNVSFVPDAGSTFLMMISAVVFTVICHVLRHLGFARYESIGYEFSFAALVISSYRLFDALLRNGSVSVTEAVIAGIYFVLFLILSYINKKLDKDLHEEINKKYEEIIYRISLDTETGRIKKKFLNNLKVISEWTLVPFPGSSKRSRLFKALTFTDKLRKFEEINRRKQDMPRLTAKIIEKIEPEYKSIVSESDFKIDVSKLKMTKRINNIISFVAFVSVFVLMAMGLI